MTSFFGAILRCIYNAMRENANSLLLINLLVYNITGVTIPVGLLITRKKNYHYPIFLHISFEKIYTRLSLVVLSYDVIFWCHFALYLQCNAMRENANTLIIINLLVYENKSLFYPYHSFASIVLNHPCFSLNYGFVSTTPVLTCHV